MSSQTYNWRRFWCPREGLLNLDDNGYLSDPESRYSQILNTSVVPFESLANYPCLVLLGEPGIGKSTALAYHQTIIEQQFTDTENVVYPLNLGAYQTDIRLCQAIFESPKFRDWRQGSHHLHLFLDSLDECLFRIDAVATLLIEEFQKYRDSVDRLWLRIACRTSDWPLSLEQGLQQIWGKDNVQVVELAPLRRQDVIEAVQANDINPTAFLTEVEQVRAVPFAIKPITLNFLINLYRKDGQLPNTQVDLYKRGCRLLCEEANPYRRDARLIGYFSTEDRLNTAAHIAAVTMFAQRYAVWTDVDHGNIPEEDITIPMLLTRGGDEINEPIIRETLSTGLFSSRGPHRLGWAHQTYAEFLAAQCLVQHKMPPSQIMSLIISPYDGQIVPQLHETAAWLAGMEPDIFRAILKIDPKILLRSDVATTSDKDRANLVAGLLEQFEVEKLLDTDLDIRTYRKLNHPYLADQLRPYIQDSSKGWLVRRVAIDIAGECELRELQIDLATVALDATQSHNTRVPAAQAVVGIGDEQTKAKLQPLVFDNASDDPGDELKGCGLYATWPNHLSTEELFQALTPPDETYSTIYTSFLDGDFLDHLQPKDLLIALQWVEKLSNLINLDDQYTISLITNSILLKAWNHLEQPGVVDLFAKIALMRLRNLHPIESSDGSLGSFSQAPEHVSFQDLLRKGYQKRRLLTLAILPLMAPTGQNADILARYKTRIILPEDFAWLIEQYQSSEEESLRVNLIALIKHTFNWQEVTHLEVAYNAYQQHVPLPLQVQQVIEGVELASPEAERMRKQYRTILDIKGGKEAQQNQPPIDPSPRVRVQELLAECESGDVTAWWRLNWSMRYKLDGTSPIKELNPDLTILPGWIEADEQTRKRIVEAAKRYVLQHRLQPKQWLHTNIVFRPDVAGYRALRLLFKEKPDFVNTLPTNMWHHWMPIIVCYPSSGDTAQKQTDQQLMQVAYQHAPEDFIKYVLQQIMYEDSATQSLTIMQRIEHCWDDRLAAALLEKLQDNTLSINGMAAVLEQLLIHEVDKAKMFAEQLVTVPVPQERESRERAIIIARILMTCTKDAGWAAIWPAFQQDPAFGREVIATIVRHAYKLTKQIGPELKAKQIGPELKAKQLVDLYLWLVQQYPFTEDPEEGSNMGIHGLIIWRRDELLQRIQSIGTQESVAALHRIAEAFPEEDRFKWALLDAHEHARQHLWVAPSPETILQLIADRQRRLVQNGEQLLAVIRESLERLEHKLHGETPAVVDLWNIPVSIAKEYIPKDENTLSDYIKRHLEDDLRERGVIANREVEIRRSEQNAKGELTDIHVQATISTPHNNGYDTITVIIEVKGCWNRELAQAMETQLVDRYLKDNQCRHGLYLIGWFNCDQWSPQDWRKQAAPKLDITKAKDQYNQQAAELSADKVKVEAYVLNTAVR